MSSAPTVSQRRLTLATLLAGIAAINLLCMPAIFWVGDPAAWREESPSMLRGTLAVDPAFASRHGEVGQYFVPNATSGEVRWYSKYGVVNSLMSLPPALVDEWVYGPPPPGLRS